MRIVLAITVLFSSAVLATGQNLQSETARFNDCKVAVVSTIDSTADVVVQRLTLSGQWGSNEAKVFLPIKKSADAGVVVSHSAVHTEEGATIDLAPMALMLARSGAAVIMGTGTIQLPAAGNPTNRQAPAAFCGAHWLLDNVSFVTKKHVFAYVGPRLCDMSPTASYCEYSEPFNSEPAGYPGNYHRSAIWVPVAEIEGGQITQGLIAKGGVLRAARLIQRSLRLAPISPIVATSSRPQVQ